MYKLEGVKMNLKENIQRIKEIMDREKKNEETLIQTILDMNFVSEYQDDVCSATYYNEDPTREYESPLIFIVFKGTIDDELENKKKYWELITKAKNEVTKYTNRYCNMKAKFSEDCEQ